MKCVNPTWIKLWRRSAKIACLLLQFFQLDELARAQEPVLVQRGAAHVTVGAERTEAYLPLLLDQRVAVVTNQTGRIGRTHLVDSLLSLGVNVVKVFSPEHGFRGDADAGAHIKDQVDPSTGLPIYALYGANYKPNPVQVADVDVIIFDIQDVGVRWYTYVSTLHYVMESAAEQGKSVVVLDRPNPNGFYVDGPIMDKSFTSFVGMHPVPMVHGMTVGEYARMINGEGWLKNGIQCELIVIGCLGYDHDVFYDLFRGHGVRPSPNLPTMAAVYLYPSLTLFEGTIVSVGRGTDLPFQCLGYPGNPVGQYQFTPVSRPGAKEPPYKNVQCSGLDLKEYGTFQSRMERRLRLHWLIGFYQEAPNKAAFFNSFFEKLAGGAELRKRIEAGEDEETIRASWAPALERFMELRRKYLLYDDFTM